jgi:hypothetical protein
MPANAALQVGLVGRITTDLILANNSVEPTLAAQGTVHLADLSAQGMIILQEDSQEVLAGMGFLVTLGLALVLTTTQIALMSEQELRRQAEERARIDSRPESTLAEAEVRLSKAQSEIAEADEAAAD